MRLSCIALSGILSLLAPLSVLQGAQVTRGALWMGEQSIAGLQHLRLHSQRQHVREASVLIDDGRCAGFVANRSDQIVTAAHCVPEDARQLLVETHDGQRHLSRLDRIDRDTDLALLHLDRPLFVTPLSLFGELPKPGQRLLFVGRQDRNTKTQLATVQKLGRCPSLPKVPKAVFTTVQARPGDSGSPLLDDRLRVVALVHGGARCHIAAPVAPLARQLEHDRGNEWVLAKSVGRE